MNKYRITVFKNLVTVYEVSGDGMTTDQAQLAVLQGTATTISESTQNSSVNISLVPAAPPASSGW